VSTSADFAAVVAGKRSISKDVTAPGQHGRMRLRVATLRGALLFVEMVTDDEVCGLAVLFSAHGFAIMSDASFFDDWISIIESRTLPIFQYAPFADAYLPPPREIVMFVAVTSHQKNT